MYVYDSIIIGAGIAGATMAHTLTQKNKNVLVLDKNGIASGGSGAAGAFISPKIGKGSALQTLTNEAFEYAKDFYLSTCPQYFHQTGVVRIPKDGEDAKKFSGYEKYNESKCEIHSKEKLNLLGINVDFNGFYFPEAGDCDAVKVCQYLLKNIDIEICEVKKIIFDNGVWVCVPTEESESKYFARNIVLATGHKNDLVDLRYMGIKGTWGTRGDFISKLDLKVSMHQSMSVGANRSGIIKLAASHEKKIKEVMPCATVQVETLKKQAHSLIDTSDLRLQKVFCGMRAGSKDYFPLVGKVIDVPYILEAYPTVVRGTKVEFKYVDNLYVLNGLGGRGFVFAPLMSKILSEYMIDDKESQSIVSPDRLFYKWVRKLSL